MAVVFKNQDRYDEDWNSYSTVQNNGDVFKTDVRDPKMVPNPHTISKIVSNPRKSVSRPSGPPDRTKSDFRTPIIFVRYQRALARGEEEGAREGPLTLSTVDNMAIVFNNQRPYDEALYMAEFENELGKNHLSTLNTRE
ncbi:hypothetical protein RUND412_003365 [Rhizina undulata]